MSPAQKQIIQAIFANDEAAVALQPGARSFHFLTRQREDAGSLVLNDEQRAELQRFQEERIRIRKELRQVRHDLNQDIDRLGAWLKFVNIALVPILLSFLTLTALIIRARRNREGLAT